MASLLIEKTPKLLEGPLVQRSTVKRRALLSLGLGLFILPSGACAEPRSWPAASRPTPPHPPRYSIELESAEGVALPSFQKNGRTFVLGEYGERYAIRIQNLSDERIEAVISVDGRDAVSGDIGDYRSQRGYLVPPHGSVRVEGFRRSLEDVATFRFSSPGESYSSRRGTPENVGVIGVAVYREKARQIIARPHPLPRPRPEEYEYRGRSARPPAESRAPESSARKSREAPAAGAQRYAPGAPHYDDGSVNNLGTEYGETRSSSVVEVPFVRRTREPERLLTVRYDDALGLERRGIDVSAYYQRPEWRYPREPEVFPHSRFAPPPR